MNQSEPVICIIRRYKLFVYRFAVFLPVFMLFGCGGGGGSNEGFTRINEKEDRKSVV